MKFIKRFAVAFTFASLIATGPAMALEVTKTATVGMSVEDVWEKIGGWCAISTWHPAIETCAESRDGETLKRLLTLGDGGQIHERLIGENETSYSYAIEKSPLPFKNYEATISVEADEKDADKTVVTWTSNFDANGKPDKEVQELVAGIYEGGLNNIVKMLSSE